MPETTPHQPQRQFTHLHLHTEYSLLDGACRIKKLMHRVKELGQTPEPETVKVPDFYGMNRQQASDAAGALGLYILVTGNDEISTGVTVTAQNVAKDTEVPAGTTITLVFADTAARD